MLFCPLIQAIYIQWAGKGVVEVKTFAHSEGWLGKVKHVLSE